MMHKISIIVPTYNERENITLLIEKLAGVLKGRDYEIIVVDDNSPDGTAEAAEALSKTLPVKVLRRPGKLGLTSAIYDGVKLATGEYIVVMDADLQHPPELVPELVEKLAECDIVVASRYVEGGGIENWSFTRRLISLGAVYASRILIPECRRVKDPVSGFFAARRSTLLGWRPLAPMGYKALVEILAVTKPRRICEVGFIFRGREKGSSKLGSRQVFSYAKLLLLLGFKRLVLIAVIFLIIAVLISLFFP